MFTPGFLPAGAKEKNRTEFTASDKIKAHQWLRRSPSFPGPQSWGQFLHQVIKAHCRFLIELFRQQYSNRFHREHSYNIS